MADDDDDDREFTDGPFGVRWLAADDQRAVFKARKRAKKTAGVWLGEAIREKVARERSDISAVDVLPPEGSSLRMIDGMSHVLDMAWKLERLRGARLSDQVTDALARQFTELVGLQGPFDRMFQRRHSGVSLITKTSAAPATDDDR